MKGICVASAATVVLFLAITLTLRIGLPSRRVRAMTRAYLLCLVMLVVFWLATPRSLGFLPLSLQTEPPALDLAAAIFFFSAAYFGGILQLYNLADRGLSLRLLFDIREAAGSTSSLIELVSAYGGGRGLRWMYDKRLRGLREGGFVTCHGSIVALTPKGAKAASLFGLIRAFLHLETDQ